MADLDDQLLETGIDLSSEEQSGQVNSENSLTFDLIENGQSNNVDSQTSADSDLEVIRARVREMEEEAEKLKKLQSQVDQEMSNTPVLSSANSSKTSSTYNLSEQEKAEADARSVYVGNVDYAATAEELEAHFHGCGSINRVTILCNKFDGHPKGFAYIEFADMDSVNTAMAMDDSLFRGRQIKVNPKRTNKPGISTTNRPVASRGRGMYRGRPMSRGSAPTGFYGGYRPIRRPRGGYSRRAMYYPY
ncbi:polyadenylate-binding protein 2 isoform X1 [Daktulosphaira vitifoliae]|uniref:polyadenylate-binding protein 2 isoform X1 n=1 Tax=Daktulosphaira vitifoliae TaxID=58002 RepID=UPI0021AA3153|nr:polyadenylate-binding protein 2 isoform X1 [Daktulosphaira vitifoliae]